MKTITLGKTGITVPQNAFGALPIQRVSKETAVALLQRAYDGGMRFFDTARAYSDSEEKIGAAFAGMRNQIYISSKTMAKTPEEYWEDLELTLHNLQTDYLDIYQFHCAAECYKPGDGTGMYEAMCEAKEQGKIRHIGITAHLISVAEESVESGLYETIQFPFSYLANEREIRLVENADKAGMGFLAMKGLAGGLLTNSEACMAFMSRYNVLPLWGIQRDNELEQWLSFFNKDVQMTEEIEEFIKKDRASLEGDFCRGCGYCMPCTVGIQINNCARMSQMIRRSPSDKYLGEEWQGLMGKIEECIDCGLCKSKCPYGLDTPNLLRKNLEDYKRILAGEVKL